MEDCGSLISCGDVVLVWGMVVQGLEGSVPHAWLVFLWRMGSMSLGLSPNSLALGTGSILGLGLVPLRDEELS